MFARTVLYRANLHDAVMLYAVTMRSLEGRDADTATIVEEMKKTSFDGITKVMLHGLSCYRACHVMGPVMLIKGWLSCK